jgi:hypothetical protein
MDQLIVGADYLPLKPVDCRTEYAVALRGPFDDDVCAASALRCPSSSAASSALRGFGHAGDG